MADDNKQSAKLFLELVVAGKIDGAYEKYVDTSGKHHNAFFAAGFESLKQAMTDNDSQFPNKKFEVKHIIGEGDLVAVHSRLSLDNGGQELTAVHILRFQNNKIVEMWDISQPVPKDSPNKDGMF